ncbi:transglutaminase family protein [Flammeovirga sp. SJP92]|uniref:transglutaminase-like domain-containing protein n=1 Tax=Flammeovirga sp. SJP92 TaxID=1775430 RepID=UPI00078827DA|nr:transglutaminase-like domain-containing protein [Flammeovirga sp. SJP92]KXX67196.1 transglutaminase [Flammeovirga sp. SJP92]
MKKIITILLSTLALWSCSESKFNGVNPQYHTLLEKALEKAGNNKTEIEKAINGISKEQKDGMAYLIAYMPERDLKSLSASYLINNVELGYKAKEEFPWAQNLPDSIFFNDVLPYALMNERRDDWRQDFYNRFAPIVKDCKTIEEAIKIVNDTIIDVVKVKYSTEREKPDQSPYESIDQGLASCSGLSVLLADAFRAVGIPARLAGTPNWTLKQGNHNWNEVWVNGRWYFTEYYPSGLDQGWFLADAGVADVNKPENWIYASSWKPAEHAFPLVWDYDIRYVHAYNVTDRYIGLWKAEEAKRASLGDKITVRVKMFKNKECTLISDNRVETQVTLSKDNEVIENGTTAGPTKDMNDILEFYLDKGKKYTLTYIDSKGKPVSKNITAEDKPLDITLYKTI